MSLSIKTAGGRFEVEDAAGRSLLDLAMQAGLHVNARCASGGICGGCTVILEQGDFVVAKHRITATQESPHTVLACQTLLETDDAEVRFPRTSIVEHDPKIDEDFTVADFAHQAQTRKYAITLGGADRQRSLWDFMHAELRSHLGEGEIGIPVACLQQIPETLNECGEGPFTVTVGRLGRGWSVIDIEPGDTTNSLLGVAVDIGTTTVVAMLVNLVNGKVLKKASMYNQQIRQADDVASRISYCRWPDRVHHLQRLVVQETVNPLIQKLCAQQGVPPDSIRRVAVSGNTVMTHLFLGISPQSIGRAPFQPVARRFESFSASDLQLRIHPLAIVDIVPSVSGYVGGDIVSDTYVARLNERAEATLLVDIGTNGEMVYSEAGEYSVCSTAAGPAFEGYGTAHGCRAATGAIEHIDFDGDLQFKLDVIGDVRPTGICGSALIDFIACGMRSGLINPMGRFDIEAIRRSGRYLFVNEICGGVHACVVVEQTDSGTGAPIYVSEADVSQIMKAKAAIYAGMKALLDVRNRTFADIRRLLLAGGFARHIHLDNAVRIGLLPEIPLDRFDVLGNGSLAGAMLALIDPEARDGFEKLAEQQQVVELNLVEGFENHFIDALALPNMNVGEFPGVMSEIGTRTRTQ